MKEQLEKIRQEALGALESVKDAGELDALRVRFLGKKGELTALLKGMKDVAAEERPVVGQLINDVRAEIETIIDKQKKLMLKDLVEYQDGQVVSKTLVQNDLVSMTVFSFDKGEEISSHSAGGDAMVTVLEGVGRFTVGGEVFILEEGETLIMPKGIPHAVFGEEKFKMQLTVSF